MQPKQRSKGKFISIAGFRKLRRPSGIPYELLVFDQGWRPVPHLNEWHRLHGEQLGTGRTRDTYLDMLLPFMGFLLKKGYAWDAEPDAIREYTRQFLRGWGCVIKRAWDTDGFHVEPSELLHPSTLSLFLAASRSFYQTMIDGEWDDVHRARVPLYAFENPMYSPMLRRWKREHLRAVANAGAPDLAGIRSETRAATSRSGIFGLEVIPGSRRWLAKRKLFEFSFAPQRISLSIGQNCASGSFCVSWLTPGRGCTRCWH